MAASMIPIRFVSVPGENYRCIKCTHILTAPIRQAYCGHRICNPCFSEISQSFRSMICPGKEEDCSITDFLKDDHVFPDFSIERDLKNMLVYCANKAEGCNETILNKNLYKHVTLDCSFGLLNGGFMEQLKMESDILGKDCKKTVNKTKVYELNSSDAGLSFESLNGKQLNTDGNCDSTNTYNSQPIISINKEKTMQLLSVSCIAEDYSHAQPTDLCILDDQIVHTAHKIDVLKGNLNENFLSLLRMVIELNRITSKLPAGRVTDKNQPRSPLIFVNEDLYIWKLDNIDELRALGKEYVESDLFSLPHGHQLCIRLYFDRKERDGNLKFNLVLNRIDSDRSLQWPFPYIVTLELLDQENIQSPQHRQITFHAKSAENAPQPTSDIYIFAENDATLNIDKGDLVEGSRFKKEGSAFAKASFVKVDSQLNHPHTTDEIVLDPPSSVLLIHNEAEE